MAEHKPDHYYSPSPKSEARYGLVRACLRGKHLEFVTATGVFSIKRVDLGTQVLIDAMALPEAGAVLDVGCGYGAVGIAAAKCNPRLRVVMTDVNRRAVLLARQNAEKNHTPNVKVHSGSLYAPVQGNCFDCILSNPPVSAGMDTVLAIIHGAPPLLTPGGTLQMVVRSKIGKKTLPDAFTEAFGNVQVLAIQSGYRVLMGQKQV
jgi:16S rRNA (guanine1207-N2)-methyltransferase